MDSPPILLTSSVVAMDTSGLLKDQDLRIFHTLESIEKWAEIAPKNKFVICDGSGYDFAPLLKQRFPHLMIECLYFLNNLKKIKIHGKGFGEGEIIRYALNNSLFLKETNWFAKCTAKLWVNNFSQCVEEWNGYFLCKAFFSQVFSLRKTRLEYIDTRFYLADKSFYEKFLSEAHQNLGGDGGLSIEEKFLEVTLMEGLSGILFKNSPIVSGVSGGSGKYYNTSHLRLIKELLRSKFVSLNPKFKKLFNRE